MCEKKGRTMNLMKNALCEYLLFYINMILICTMCPVITLKWNIPLKEYENEKSQQNIYRKF